MKIEIPISHQSQKQINYLTKNYTETKEVPEKINGRTLIHIYPKEDTIEDGTDDSRGFVDALNCEIHIYNTDNMTVFKTKRHDQIEMRVPCNVRIFKDLSTMLIIDTPVTFGIYQSLEVRKVLV